jgi:small subunit ribosomal protein S20
VANHKSAAKRARQTITKRTLNRSKRSKVRTFIKRVKTAIETGNKKDAQTNLTTVQSLLAKMAKSGIIKKNNASRRTSRLATQVNALK